MVHTKKKKKKKLKKILVERFVEEGQIEMHFLTLK